MCDLCCCILTTAYPPRIGDNVLCFRCWERYERLWNLGVGHDMGHRLYIVQQAHAVLGCDCPGSASVWVDRRGEAYVATYEEIAACTTWKPQPSERTLVLA